MRPMTRQAWDKPAWLLGLSNAALIAAFGTTIAARDARGDAPDLMHRLDLLHDEITRRARAELLTEDDWT
jgi:hypothetical protein